MTDSDLWHRILNEIRARVSRHAFEVWFAPMLLRAHAGGRLTVEVPNELFRDWVVCHYSDILTGAVHAVGASETVVDFITANLVEAGASDGRASVSSLGPQAQDPDQRLRQGLEALSKEVRDLTEEVRRAHADVIERLERRGSS